MFKKHILAVLLLALFINTTSIMAADQSAEKVELNQSGIVTEITVNPNVLRRGHQTVVTVKFDSEESIDVDRNSIITIKNPHTDENNKTQSENGDIDFFRHNSKDNPIILTDTINGKEVEFAHAYFLENTGDLIVEFLPVVEQMTRIRGEISFTAAAEFNKTDDGSEMIENVEYTNYRAYRFGTSLDSVLYEIKHTEKPYKGNYFSKPGGRIYTNDVNHVNWWLHLNTARDEHKDDVTIVDTLGAGQAFVLKDPNQGVNVENLDYDFFSFARTDDNGYSPLSVAEFISRGYGTFEFLSDTEFKVVFFKDLMMPDARYDIIYRTRITPEGKYMPILYNSAVGTYMENGVLKTDNQPNRKAENVFAEGNIKVEPNKLTIQKIAVADGEDMPLPNTVFKIFHADGSEVDYLGTTVFTTNSKGIATTPKLDPGDYYVSEISAPEYVNFDPSEKYPFTIEDNDSSGALLVISNDVAKTDVTVNKVWNDFIDTHPSITINLLADGLIVDTVTLKDGQVSHTFKDLYQYKVDGTKINYTVEEEDLDGYTSQTVDDGDNSFTITNTAVKAEGKLSATKEASVSEVRLNDTFTYTINVKNTIENSEPLKNIKVEDILPKGLSFTDKKVYLNGELKNVTISDNAFSLILEEVEYNKNYTISFEVKVIEEVKDALINKALITNPDDPTNPLEPEVTVPLIPKGVLNAKKQVSQEEVKPNETFTYSILVTNTKEGSDPLKDILVEDVLPKGISFVDDRIFVDGSLTPATITKDSFSLTLEEVHYGSEKTISFRVKADEDTFGNLINIATVTNPEDPENPETPEVPVTVIPSAKLEATKEASKEILDIHEVFTYSIRVKNVSEGSRPAKNIKVEDTLPEGIVFTDKIITVNNVIVDADVTDRSFSLMIDALAYNEEALIQFEVKTEDIFGTRKNTAKITNPEDPEKPLEPEVDVTVTPKGSLEAEKRVSKETIKPNEVFTYTIIVKNTKEGSESLKNITVSDTLPLGIDFSDKQIFVDGVLAPIIVFNNSFSTVIPELAYGKDVQISFGVKTQLNTKQSFTNVATIVDPEDPNNPLEPEVPVTLIPLGELEAKKTVSKDEVKPDEVFEYKITVQNTVEGSEPLKNVRVEDFLPEGIVFDDQKIYVNGKETEATITDQSFSLILDEVLNDKEAIISFRVKALESTFGERVNKAKVTNPNDPSNPLEPEVPVTIVPVGRIAADKKVNKKVVEANEVFEYTIIVKNIVEGSKALENVEVMDKLPKGIQYISNEVLINGVKTTIPISKDSFVYVIDKLEYGHDFEITFKTIALDGIFGEKINIATVTDPEDPENPEEPEVPVEVLLDGKLEAEKTINKQTIKPNEKAVYTIVVRNTVEGSEPIKNVTVSDVLPQGISFTDHSLFANFEAKNIVFEDQSFSLQIDEVMYGVDYEIKFEVIANEGAFGEKINIATVTDPEDPTNPLEPEVPVTVIPDGKLEAQKTVSKDHVKPNEVFDYTITIKNITEGSHPLKNIKVEDTLPDGISFVDKKIYLNNVEVQAAITDQSFMLVLENLAYGDDAVLTFKVKADEGVFGEKINIATITDPEDPTNPLEPEAPVTVIPDGKLEAQKTVSKDHIKPNEVFDYTITIKNIAEGSNPLKNIKVEDTLPEGISFVDKKIYLNNVEVQASITDQSFMLVLENLAYGDDAVLTFKVKADEGVFGEKINVATVTNPEDPTNPLEPEVPVTVIPDGTIEASKTVSKAEVKVNEVFDYTITIKNITEGSNPLKNIKVEDTLPEGIVFEDKIVYVNGVETNALISNTSLELVLEELVYKEDINITFSVRALSGGLKLNVATITDPEDPANPLQPEVPIEVFEEVTVPEKENPKTPSTGLSNNYVMYLNIILLFSLVLIGLSTKKKERKN